jgi:hypothetical protein
MKPEVKLWHELKRTTTKISFTRLENRALFGTPDLLGYNPNGRFSPHQISFHMKHNLNTFILVACSLDKGLVRLYPGSEILNLVQEGLKLEPLACGLGPSVQLLESL